jgi:hypothetical protein
VLKKTINFGTAAAISLMALAPATPALAHRNHDRGNGYYQSYDDGYYRDRGYRNDRRYQNYDNRDYNYRDNGYRCKRGGTTGLIIGAVAGGLLGKAVVGRRGDSTAGVIIGGGAGALAGRAIERNGNNRC